MPPVTLKVVSPDSTFLDFYERLAHSLGNAGTVYTPHPVIPPNSRMAIPAPTDVLIALESTDSFSKVHEGVRHYLEGGPGRQLTLVFGGRAVKFEKFAGRELPDAAATARRLFMGEGEDDLEAEKGLQS